MDARCLLALWALSQFELHLLAIFERVEAVHLDCGEMREEILVAIVGRHESVALGVVETARDRIRIRSSG